MIEDLEERIEERISAFEKGMSLEIYREWKESEMIRNAVETGDIGWVIGYLAFRDLSPKNLEKYENSRHST